MARAVGQLTDGHSALLAILCILAVFVPSFFMSGAARELFVPLSLAVGFAMVASYLLSSTFVPIVAVWLLKSHPISPETPTRVGIVGRMKQNYSGALSLIALLRWATSGMSPINQQRSPVIQLLPLYAIGSVAMFWVIQRIAAF